MSNIKLGKIIDGDTFPERDAVHVAVVPVIAAESLRPGQHVGIAPGNLGTAVQGSLCERVHSCAPRLIGTIDPFLNQPVNAGEKCWLFMYPDTVKGLHHDWTHPAFDGEAPPALAKMIAKEQESEDYNDPPIDDEEDWCKTDCYDH